MFLFAVVLEARDEKQAGAMTSVEQYMKDESFGEGITIFKQTLLIHEY